MMPRIHCLAVALLTLLGLAAVPVRTYAQLTIPGVLGSQLAESERGDPISLTLLQPFRGPLPAEGVTLGALNEVTVHSSKRAVGVVDDLHANGRFISAVIATGRSRGAPQILVRWPQIDEGGAMNDHGTLLNLHGHFEEPQIRLLWAHRPDRRFYIGYSQTRYTADGTTNLYQNIFTIFPDTPPFHLETQTRLATLGAVVPLARRVTAEVLLGRGTSPGSLTVEDSTARLQIPLQDAGTVAAGALRYHAAPRSTLFLFGSLSDFSGTGAVLREGDRSIGTGTTTRREDEIGLGWQRDISASRRLTLHYDRSHARWDTQGLIPDPRDLNTQLPLASNLNYHAGYRVGKQMWGLSWEHEARARHTLRVGYDYVIVATHIQADYNARVFGFPHGDESSQDQTGLRGHLIQIRYAFPVSGLNSALSVSQVIPARLRGGSHGIGGGGGGGGTTTYGGWTLGWSLNHPF